MGGTFNSNSAPQGLTLPSTNGVSLLESESTSRLPVPYTGQQLVPLTHTGDFPTIHTEVHENALAPATPDEHEIIHVPPMYVKPRPFIPRYRIISGLISFFVVIGLLCGGSIYYAQATGRLGFLQQLVNPQFQNLQGSPVTQLPTPTLQAQYSQKATPITSATTASSIDTANSQPKIPTNKFIVGKPIYVTFTVHSNQGGTVSFKWYTNGLFFYSSRPESIPAEQNGSSVSDSTAVIYSRPAEGSVELYWNGTFAVRLYFVVEPDPNGGQ